jgi:lipooligosaccharide transport system ATP-binding protein
VLPWRAPMSIVVDVSKVSKHYDSREVVHELSLQVRAGQCFGLLGPNGAGKSTSLRMIYGVTAPSTGSVHVFGLDVASESRAVRARLGVTLQDNVMIDALSPVENLRVFGRYHLLREPLLSQRIAQLVDYLELGSHANIPVIALSGGFKRRLAIAMSLINEPELLILDEPTTGLDPQARHLIWDGLRQLLSQGKTILLTTHFMDEAERLCSRLAVIDHGVMIACDSPRALIAAHVEPEVVEVYGDEVRAWVDARGRAFSDRVEVAGETAFCYARDAAPLLADLAKTSGLRYLHRPANVEDLFIKLTGRELRD